LSQYTRLTDRRTEFRQQYRALHHMQSHGKREQCITLDPSRLADLKERRQLLQRGCGAPGPKTILLLSKTDKMPILDRELHCVSKKFPLLNSL